MKIEKQILVPECFSKGRNANRCIKRQNKKIDEQFAEARMHWWDKTQPVPAPVIVLHCDIDAQKLEVPHTMMRAYVGNRQARIVGDFNTMPDVQIVSDQEE